MSQAALAITRLGVAMVIGLVAAGCSQPDGGAGVTVTDESSGAGLVGEWTLSIDTPRGEQNPTLVVTQTDSGYSATYNSRQGTSVIDAVSVEGQRFSFPMELTIPIGTIEVRYAGEIDGDQMQGVVENPRGQVPFSGVRAG